jgi:hypothetical protein
LALPDAVFWDQAIDACRLRRMRGVLVMTLGLALGCQTAFVGSAHIDIATCEATCAQSKLRMAAMIYMGEYSSACVCEVARPGPNAAASTAAGAVGATAGVIQQMRRDQQRANQQALPTPH